MFSLSWVYQFKSRTCVALEGWGVAPTAQHVYILYIRYPSIVTIHKSAAAEAGEVAENQALKLSAVDDDIMIEFQAFSVISAVVPTTTG